MLRSFGLLEPLSLALPTPDETALLRACLHSGPAGRRAWEDARRLMAPLLRERPRPPAATWPNANGLLPLLLTTLRRSGAPLDDRFQTVLRTAYVVEDARSRAYRRVAGQVIAALTRARIPVIVLKGAALAETVYPDPALRHCHDIDLLVRGCDLRQAASVCAPLDFTPVTNGLDPGAPPARLVHATGLPVELHSRLFRVPFYEATFDDVWERSRDQVVAGVPTRVLCAVDSLLHVCGHASYCRNRESLRWVCDAWLIIERHAALDWDELLTRARRWHLSVPMAVTLRYLANELAAGIPPSVLLRLPAVAAGSDTFEREAALAGARRAPRWSVRRALRASPDWGTRLFVLRWLAVPSPRYVRAIEPAAPWLPLAYVRRAVRYIGRHLYGRRSRGPAESPRVETDARLG